MIHSWSEKFIPKFLIHHQATKTLLTPLIQEIPNCFSAAWWTIAIISGAHDNHSGHNTYHLTTIGGCWYFDRTFGLERLKNLSLYNKIQLLQKFNITLEKVFKLFIFSLWNHGGCQRPFPFLWYERYLTTIGVCSYVLWLVD